MPPRRAGTARPERPPHLSKAERDQERFPSLDAHPMLKRALVLHRALQAGKSRAEAEAEADRKVGPRAPHFKAKPQRAGRGKRPEPEKRVRAAATPMRAATPGRKSRR